MINKKINKIYIMKKMNIFSNKKVKKAYFINITLK